MFAPSEVPQRILVHAPRGRDADVVCHVLQTQFSRPSVCASLDSLAQAVEAGADIAFVTEETLSGPALEVLGRWIDEQPPWSDFPFIVLTSRRVGRRPNDASGALHRLGNVVLLERPLNADTLVSAARAALRARTRQHEMRRQLMIEEESRDAERLARLEAERAGRMKDDFLATLSHELRTPLSAILGWTHLLQHPGARGVDLARAVATIDRNARAQARLIEELLDVSRITSGNFELDIKKVSLEAVFESAVQSLQPAADAKRIALERIEGAAVELQADPGRMQQIVWNLLSNAIKFTGEGGRVTLRAEVRDDEAWLTIADTGAGISAEFLPHVFERFRQAESSEARSFGGLGLGLAIVRQLVELHGGQVYAASEGLDRGATFVVRLPLVAARARPAAAEPSSTLIPPAPAAAELAGLRVLVVDDEADGREMLASLLETRGAEVAAAGSAEEALGLLAEELPDVLVSDIGMPRVDGYELIRRIRRVERPGLRDLPAIAVTAFARLGDGDKARDAGYGAHLAKPVEPAELFLAIRSVVANCRR
ncbi:MAG: response regulator [Burkholderiales bacterium]|nr:response regulator [Burkholderiales bacterium]